MSSEVQDALYRIITKPLFCLMTASDEQHMGSQVGSPRVCTTCSPWQWFQAWTTGPGCRRTDHVALHQWHQYANVLWQHWWVNPDNVFLNLIRKVPPWQLHIQNTYIFCGLRWPLYRGSSVRHQNYSLISQN
jgi:hypothetical protein